MICSSVPAALRGRHFPIYGVAALIAAGCFGTYAQSLKAPLGFEVASVRPAPPVGSGGLHARFSGGPGTNDPERFTADSVAFLAIVMKAYHIEQRFQLSWQQWMETERYSITAKVPPGTSKEQFRVMLQRLLAERFGLKVHRETRKMQIYELVVAKNGHKLKESVPTPPRDPDHSAMLLSKLNITMDKDGLPMMPPGDAPMTFVANGRTVIRARNETAEEIAAKLWNYAQRPVRDATGLKGKYDYTLSWGVDPGIISRSAADRNRANEVAPTEPDGGTTLFVALEEQLGLKLLPKKGPVEILAIDYAQKTPTEN